MSNVQSVDICINGGGPIGATLACYLSAIGFKVLLIERANLADLEDPKIDGRAYALTEGTRRTMQEAGVWQHLASPAQPIRKITVRDGRPRNPSSSQQIDLEPRDAPSSPEGPLAFGWMVEARQLRYALNQALATHPPSHLLVCAPDTASFTFSPQNVRIQLESGALYQASLAIAADGRQSHLSAQVGIPLTRLPYHQSGIITVIHHDRPHEGRALEHFLPEGPFARLPLAPLENAPHRSAIVWAAASARAEHFYRLEGDVFTREIMIRLGDDIGPVTPVGPRWIYPLAAQYAQYYTHQRLALVGDAAHGLHPVAGQGMNVGFKDVVALVELLRDAKERGDDFGSQRILKRYQQLTRPYNMAMLAACDSLERLFASDRRLIRAARDTGMRLFARMPRARRFFVKKAMGL